MNEVVTCRYRVTKRFHKTSSCFPWNSTVEAENIGWLRKTPFLSPRESFSNSRDARKNVNRRSLKRERLKLRLARNNIIFEKRVVQNGEILFFDRACNPRARAEMTWKNTWKRRGKEKRYKVLSETRVETGTSMSRRNVWREEFFKAWRYRLCAWRRLALAKFDLTSSRKIWLRNHRKPFRSAEPFTPRS